MQIPNYGNAAPVAKFFLLIRSLQLFVFILLIGIIANYISTISSSSTIPTAPLLLLFLPSLSALYALLTLPFFLSRVSRGLLIMCALDLVFLVTYIITTILVANRIQSAGVVCANVKDVLFKGTGSGTGSAGTFGGWMGRSRVDCWIVRGGWWGGVVVCVLLAITTLLLPALFAKQKRAAKAGGSA